MVAALRVGVRRGVTEPTLADRVTTLLAALGLPTELAPAQVERAVGLISLDKKRIGGCVRSVFLRAVLVRRPAEAFLRPFSLSDLAAAFRNAANFAWP